MRTIPRVLLAAFFVLLILGAAEPAIPITDHAGTQADPMLAYNTETLGLSFNDTYTAANVTLARIDVEILDAQGANVAAWAITTGWFLEGAAWRIPIRQYAELLDNGVYQMRVRVWDTYGSVSAWAPAVWISKQWRTIEPPGGCRTVG